MKGFLKCFGFGRTHLRKRKQKAVIQSAAHGPQVLGVQKNLMIREFSWEEIERWTGSFSRSRVIGCGGFSTVYLGDIDDPQLKSASTSASASAAIKIIYGRRVFEEELKMLRQLQHGNIVELMGYSRSDGDDQLGALVLEYIPNGTLEEKLLGATNTDQVIIPWMKRMAIAHQVAEALEYLHEKCGSLPVVHGDIKASNVLLDANLNSRLCDLGSAKMGFSAAVATERRITMMGSPGYTDPHYLRTGIPSKKNDVYGFGVILLQLLSGAHPFCPRTGQLLGPIQDIIAHLDDGTCDADAAAGLVDPRLAGRFDRQEASAMLCLSARCLRQAPSLRPCATQILHTISSNCNTTPISSLFVSSKHHST